MLRAEDATARLKALEDPLARLGSAQIAPNLLPVWQACCLGRGPAVVRQGSEVDRETPFVCRGFLLLFASGGLWAAGVE